VDHASRIFSFMLGVAQGTRANPISVIVLPWMLQGTQLVTVPTPDGGGVHLNATVLSHAFYLAMKADGMPHPASQSPASAQRTGSRLNARSSAR
jgi:hypothetical protein